MIWTTLGVVLYGLQAAQAVNVYLYPPQTFLRSKLSPEDASAALSRHLGLEIFEALRDSSSLDYAEESFVGQGPNDVLLLTLDETDAKVSVRIPSSIRPSFDLSTPPSTPISSLSSVISTYLHQRVQDCRWTRPARSSNTPSTTTSTSPCSPFRPRPTRGEACAGPAGLQAPFPRPPPQSPIGSISTCHTTLDACSNATSSCSGRGECSGATKSGRTCFVCSCGTTRTGSGNQVKTETWVGESCERKDISAPFVLLTGTTIVLLLVIAGSVSLLYTVGNIELPSVLMGGAVNAKKD
ncbi:hypothetical protein C8R43DRAFT_1054067 [Mycena crocata]|nr:hypothetical protein C8R43DRAFT_1054067 [Mycena crocata]